MIQSKALRRVAALLGVCALATVPSSAAGLESFDHEEIRQLLSLSSDRCATPDYHARLDMFGPGSGDAPSDCSSQQTNPRPEFEPLGGPFYEIPVVVHVLMDDSCSNGQISDAMVQSQIDILNEDFLALSSSNGANGNLARVRFKLATIDPQGNPTNGITRDCNTSWYNDGFFTNYFGELNWDPFRYLNIYTNNTFALGYVNFLPADSGGNLVGNANDGVVVLWTSFGRNGPIGPPYNLGRTTTHEVGHYLGLEHTFTGGCGTQSEPGCYSSGDMICDTNGESTPTYSPCSVGSKSTCGTVDPSDNYMDYSNDACMMQFTPEQVNRVRCTLEEYRPDLWRLVNLAVSEPSPGQPGQVNTWTVTDATPNQTLYVLQGTSAGSTPIPGCPGLTANIANGQVLGTGVANANGVATVTRNIPLSASGSTRRFQAAELESCTLTPVVTYTIP